MKIKPIKIDDRICIGQMLVGTMSHYSNDDVLKNDDLQYIAKTLKKINYQLKNGSAKDRAEVIRAQKIKNKKLFDVSLNKIALARSTWDIHSHIADDAWNDAVKKLPSHTMFSAIGLIYFLLKKRKDVLKFYSFDEKRLESIFELSDGKSTHSFQSMRTSSALLKSLEYRIANYYGMINNHNKEQTDASSTNKLHNEKRM